MASPAPALISCRVVDAAGNPIAGARVYFTRGPGSFPDVAPDVIGGHGNVAWGDAGVICPYVIWQHYGDTRVIERHYDAMARYVDYLQRTATDDVRGVGAYGDWVNQGGGANTARMLAATVAPNTNIVTVPAAA